MATHWFLARRTHDRALRRRIERRRRFSIEPLEGRQMLSTFTVTNSNDSGAGSFRQALLNSNATSGPNSVVFNIPGGGVHTINLLSALPVVTHAVSIDGTTEPGYKTPVIVLDGSSAGASAVGLDLAASAAGSTVKGLVVGAFGGGGVFVNGGSSDTISGDYIGVGATGSTAAGNGNYGVRINAQAKGIVVSGDLISSNAGPGVDIKGAGTSGNLVAGDLIGVDLTGSLELPNSGDGVLVEAGSSQNTIGGTTSAGAT